MNRPKEVTPGDKTRAFRTFAELGIRQSGPVN
jgi:hypothetical protein